MQPGPSLTSLEPTSEFSSPYPIKNLSPQMIRVLMFLARGMTYQQIASELQITRHTVSSYVQHIFERFGVRTRTQAVVIGLTRGIIK